MNTLTDKDIQEWFIFVDLWLEAHGLGYNL